MKETRNEGETFYPIIISCTVVVDNTPSILGPTLFTDTTQTLSFWVRTPPLVTRPLTPKTPDNSFSFVDSDNPVPGLRGWYRGTPEFDHRTGRTLDSSASLFFLGRERRGLRRTDQYQVPNTEIPPTRGTSSPTTEPLPVGDGWGTSDTGSGLSRNYPVLPSTHTHRNLRELAVPTPTTSVHPPTPS